jgi:hypothetical protein
MAAKHAAPLRLLERAGGGNRAENVKHAAFAGICRLKSEPFRVRLGRDESSAILSNTKTYPKREDFWVPKP